MSLQITASTPFAVRIGPAGWSYKDWEGVVYPAAPGRRFDPLAYLVHYFDTIEVNSSFYRIPPPTHATSWVRRAAANPHFRFTAKLYRGFTHEQQWKAEDAAAFRRFLDPLQQEGRLGGLLIQFPWSFKSEPGSMSRMERIFEAFPGYPKVVELRHGSFQNEELFRFLEDRGVGFANIDQPLFGDSVTPSAISSGPAAYVRFHGRNYQKWFQHEESWERYDYLYTLSELEPWIERVRELSRAKDVYVITNNHFRGQAIVNAIEVKRSLGQTAAVPGPLRDAYPERLGESE